MIERKTDILNAIKSLEEERRMNNTKNSQFYFAPLEGITGYIYRNAFHETFGAADKYFIPFISPGAKKKLTEKERNDILPEHNAGMNAVPQILSKNAQDVVATCEMLKELGYKEVKNIHIHLTRLLLHFLLMYKQQHLQLHLEEYLQTTMTFFLWQMGVYVIHIDYWRFPIFRLIEILLIVPYGSWHSLVPW